MRPRATRRCFTWSMTSDTSRTTWSPCSEMAPDSSPSRRRTSAACALVFAVTQKSAKASEATNSFTCVSISPLTAPEIGPTRACRRGRSVMTPANTSLRIASTSTCCWIASVTLVAIAACTSGESTKRAHRLDVALRVVEGALPPERHRGRQRQQRREHDADSRRDGPTLGGALHHDFFRDISSAIASSPRSEHGCARGPATAVRSRRSSHLASCRRCPSVTSQVPSRDSMVSGS